MRKVAMSKKQRAMLCELQALEFFAVELNLFLDTHPRNCRALADYNRTVMELWTMKRAYERCYGPLVNFGFSPSPGKWRWIDEPWPWKICG